MSISGLDQILSRVSYLDRQFDILANKSSSDNQIKNEVSKPSNSEFENILSYKARERVFPGQAEPYNNGKLSKEHIENLIEKHCEKHNIDSDFVKAVINQESGFNHRAVSKCGAMGLMQLMPGTAQALGVTDPYDPAQNIEGGVKYLKGLLDRFGQDKKLALAAYNAGPNAVKKYNGVPPYMETQNYLKNILSMYERFKNGEQM